MYKPKPIKFKKRVYQSVADRYERQATGYKALAFSTIVATGKFCFGYLVSSILWMYSGSFSAAVVIALLVALLFQTKKLKNPVRCYWFVTAIMLLRAVTFDIYILNQTSAFRSTWVTDKRIIPIFEIVILIQYISAFIGLGYAKKEDRPIVESIQSLKLSNAFMNTLLTVHLLLPFFLNEKKLVLKAKLISNFIFAVLITGFSIYMIYHSFTTYKAQKSQSAGLQPASDAQ